MGDEDVGLKFEVRDPDILRMDDTTGNMTAMKEGETYVFLKNSEGEVLKGMPIWVTPVHKVDVTAHPHPESRQLIKKQDYDLHVDLYNKEGKKLYPSEASYIICLLITLQCSILSCLDVILEHFGESDLSGILS